MMSLVRAQQGEPKKKQIALRSAFLSFALIALNRQDIMIAQLVALSDVCEANSQLSGAKHCRWFELSRGSQTRIIRNFYQLVTVSDFLFISKIKMHGILSNSVLFCFARF